MTEIQRPSQQKQAKILALQSGAKNDLEMARKRASEMGLYF